MRINGSRLAVGMKFLYLLPIIGVVVMFASPTMRATLWKTVERSRGGGRGGESFQVQSVGLKDNRILVRLPDMTLSITKSGNVWRVEGGVQPARLRLSEAGNGWEAAAIPQIEGGELRYRREGNLVLSAPGVAMHFYVVGSRIFGVYKDRLYSELRLSPFAVTGFESFLNGRGFIWERALSVVGDNFWFGSGPGTLALVFPNADLLDKQRFAYNSDNDKGHGIWVSFLVQLGVIGVLVYSLLVLYTLFVAYRHGGVLSVPIVLGMAGYLICSITNDSTVGVTPIFCVLVGLSVTEASSSSSVTK